MKNHVTSPKFHFLALIISLGICLVWFSNREHKALDENLETSGHDSDLESSTEKSSRNPSSSNGGIGQSFLYSGSTFEIFDEWIERYVSDNPADRDDLISEGVTLSKERLQELKGLIKLDPELALSLAIPYAIRRYLPLEIMSYLESPVSGYARFELLVYCPEPGQRGGGYERIAKVGNEVFEVYTYGRRLEVTTKDKLSVHGISIDGILAMEEEPVRVFSDLERSDRGYESGLVVSIGGNLYEVSDTDALERLGENLEQDEASVGPLLGVGQSALLSGQIEGVTLLFAADPDDGINDYDLPEAQSDHTEGPKRMLYIRARFSDQAANYEPNTLATLMPRQAACEAYWFENSYGKSTLSTIFTDVVSLPDSASDYADLTSGRLNSLYDDVTPLIIAAGQAKGQDWDPANYDFFTLLTTGGTWGYAGVASVGGRRSHLNGAGSSNIRTASHEFGHNLSLRHANYWRTDSTSPIGRDSVPGGYSPDGVGDERIEYGHKFSVMGAQNGGGDLNAGRGHYTTGEKVQLDWLVAGVGDWVSVSESTQAPIRLYRHDVESELFGSMTPGVPRAIKINRDSGDYAETNKRRYWLSYRRLPTNGISEEWLPYGLEVDWQRDNYGNDGSIQIDMTPYSRDDSNPAQSIRRDNNDKEDAVLVVGRTYSDPVADIHFTPITQGGENPNEWIDVMVNIGTQRSNNRPAILNFTASFIEIGRGKAVDFEVLAEDPDGDTLYYSWTFADNLLLVESLNFQTASMSWNQDGLYPVRVTASDGRGGSDTREIIVNVGPVFPDLTISGRVIHAGLPVEGARVVIQEDEAVAWTDGNGIYMLPGLTSRIPLIEVAKDDLIFEPVFPNPMSLFGQDVTGLDWVALDDGAGTGALELALTPYISVIPIGSDIKLTAWGWDAFGKAIQVSPDWSVSSGGTISDDGLFEGSELGGPYTITATQGSSVAHAEVSVSNFEAVGIVALTSELGESENQSGAFRIRRYGSTDGRLGVSYNWLGFGSATWGEDYVGINSSVDIPDGESFVDIPITVLDDSEVESTEQITLVLGTSSSFNVYSGEGSATINILDDADRAPEVSIKSPTQALAIVPEGSGLLIETEVSDDGFPSPPGETTLTWSVLQAPAGGSVLFSPPQGLSTVANFNVPGIYKILVTADDGVNTGTAELSVNAGVVAGSNPSEENEIVYFNFEERAGNTATDIRGGDNNGILVGAMNWTGIEFRISGSGLVFDGVDDQVNIPISPDINLQDHSLRSIVLWFKAEDPLKKTKQVLYEEGGGTRGFNIYLEDGLLYVGGWNNGANSWEETYLSTDITDTEWHHAALVLNAQVSTDLQPDAFKGYLDGLEFGSGGAATLDPHNGAIAIGAVNGATQFHDGNSSGATGRFTGIIDEFHLWNRALTPGEIGQLFGGGYIGPEVAVSSVSTTYGSVIVPSGMGMVLNTSTPGVDSLETMWYEVISPEGGEVSFGNAFDENTVASFSKPGFYKLRFSASDGIQKSALDVNVYAGIDSSEDPELVSQAIYLALDEGTGQTTTNTGYDGEVYFLENASSWSSAGEGISGTAATFDGVQDYIGFPSNSEVENSSLRKSISLWFKPVAETESFREVIFETGGEGDGINLYLEGNLLYFGAYSTLVREDWETFISVPIVRDQWHHAVLVLDPPTTQRIYPDAFRVYLDGTQVGVGPGATFPGASRPGLGGVNFTTTFHDGSLIINERLPFAGLIDEFRYFHNYALAIDQIGMLYAFGNIGPRVDAGPDQPGLSSLTNLLAGTASDDGRWIDSLTYKWGFVDRHGAGTFSPPNGSEPNTELELLAGGSYRVYLGAFDGQVTTYDEIVVTVDQPTYFDLWLDDYPSITGDDRTPESNPDNDQRSNLNEYSFGGVPDVGEGYYAFRLQSDIVLESDIMYSEFRYPRRIDRALRGMNYVFEVSGDLSSESWVIPDYAVMEINVIDDTFEEVHLRLNEPIGSSQSRLFGRVKIILND